MTEHRADLGKDPDRVSGMFDEVAAGYDRTNTVLSLGNDRLWHIATTRAVAPKPGQRILDLAAGTGASSVALARSGADIVKSLALGATAVGVGRPYAYGLAIGGEDGAAGRIGIDAEDAPSLHVQVAGDGAAHDAEDHHDAHRAATDDDGDCNGDDDANTKSAILQYPKPIDALNRWLTFTCCVISTCKACV